MNFITAMNTEQLCSKVNGYAQCECERWGKTI